MEEEKQANSAVLSEAEMKYGDIKITHIEHLAIISYLTKAMEDILIRRVRILRFPLLLIDIPLLIAMLIVNLERFIYHNVVEYLFAYIKFDIRVVTRGLKKVFNMQRHEDFEEEEEEELYEESLQGKTFQWLRNTLQFLWGLLILGMILPIWPLIILYNLFIEWIIVAGMYYFLMFYHFPDWWGPWLYYLTFCVVTFIIASISVPAILRTFTYIKYLFSLKRKNWREIDNEARAAFISFYLRIQKNQLRILENADGQSEGEDTSKKIKAEGGIYYLILKVIYAVKDQLVGMRKKRAMKLFEKVDQGLKNVSHELADQKEKYEQSISEMSPGELGKTAAALLITFVISALLVSRGTTGQGVIGPVLLSFVDQTRSVILWNNYNNTGLGYFSFLGQEITFLPGLIKGICFGIDVFFQYFFQWYYYLLPWYLNFIGTYYNFYFQIFRRIFY